MTHRIFTVLYVIAITLATVSETTAQSAETNALTLLADIQSTEEVPPPHTLFIRVSSGSQLAFYTYDATSRLQLAAGVSYNPETQYSEVLAGIGYKVNGQNIGLVPYATVAYDIPNKVMYGEWFLGPWFKSGRLSGDAFVVGYVPVNSHGIWQLGVDNAHLMVAVDPSWELGAVYASYMVDQGQYAQAWGPSVKLGRLNGRASTIQLDFLTFGDESQRQVRISVPLAFR